MRVQLKLAWRNIWRNKRRTFITQFALAMTLSLMIAYSGLVWGLLGQMERNATLLGPAEIQIHSPGYLFDRSIYKTIPAPDQIVAAIEMNLDVTPHKQLEEKLKLSEEKYRAIFNNIPNPVFVLDFDTLEILDCNHRVKDMYGYASHEIIGRSFMDLFHDDDKNDSTAKGIRSGTAIHQIKHRDKTDRVIYVDIWISPSEYPDKKVLIYIFSAIVSTVFSVHLYTSLLGYYTRFHGGLVSFLAFFVIYFVAVNTFDKKNFVKLFEIAVLSTLVVSIYAVFQRFGLFSSIWERWIQNLRPFG